MPSTFRESFWDARRNPLVFFLVAYCFGISINLASDHFQSEPWKWFFLAAVPGIILLVILSPLYQQLVSARFIEATPVLVEARKYPALVAFASPGTGIETAEAAILFHEPEHTWLFYSDTSTDSAVALKAKLMRGDIKWDQKLHLQHLTNEQFCDPEDVRDQIERIVFDKLPENLTESQVVIDFTGGMKTTTAGAFLAGLPAGRNLEIVTPARTDKDGRGTQAGNIVQFNIDYRVKRLRSGRRKHGR